MIGRCGIPVESMLWTSRDNELRSWTSSYI